LAICLKKFAIPAVERGDVSSANLAALFRSEPTFTPIPDFTHNGTFGLAQLINVALGRAP
jgi:hypothetical protein